MIKKKRKGLKTAIMSHRGGCGKTYSVHMLTSILSSLGKKVLVLDGCSTGAMTRRLLPQKVLDNSKELITLYNILCSPKKYHWADACYKSDRYRNVFAIPTDYGLGDEIAPVLRRISPRNSEKALSKILAGMEDTFDHILFDCNNGVHQFNQAILDWSDRYITPSNKTCDGLSSAMDIQDLATEMGLDPKSHLGLLLCGVPNQKSSKKAFNKKLSGYKGKILGRTPESQKIDEYANDGKTFFDVKSYKYHPLTKVYTEIVKKHFR